MNIYQHPQRQGTREIHRYNMGREIYSLGVCLLEVGLWEALVEAEPTKLDSEVLVQLEPSKVSSLLKRVWKPIVADNATAAYLNKMSELYLEEPLRGENGSLQVSDNLVRIAKETLPPKMDSAFTNLVVTCPTCLDGDSDGTWQSVSFISAKSIDIQRVFTTVVISVLSSIRLGPRASARD